MIHRAATEKGTIQKRARSRHTEDEQRNLYNAADMFT